MNTHLALYAVISVVKPMDMQGKEYENYPIVNKLACLVCTLKGLCLLVVSKVLEHCSNDDSVDIYGI